MGHISRDCPATKQPAEARGTSLIVYGESREQPQDGATEEFRRLSEAYANEVNVTNVTGALGPLYYAAVTVAGETIEALVDPGSSASMKPSKA